MTISLAKKQLTRAIALFKAMPSAFHYRLLEKAMREYQDATFPPK